MKHSQSLTKTLFRTKFSERIMAVTRPVLGATLHGRPKKPAEIAEWQRNNRKRMSHAERYVVDVMYPWIAVTNVANRIETAERLLYLSPRSFRNPPASVDRDDWTEYHFTALTVAFGSVLDVGLILSSKVFELGLAPRHITLDVLSNHASVGTGPVRTALRSLDKFLERHRERRNRIVHRGERADFGELTDEEFIGTLRSLTFLNRVGPKAVASSELSGWWRHALAELQPVLAASSDGAAKELERLMDALLPQLEMRLKAYGNL